MRSRRGLGECRGCALNGVVYYEPADGSSGAEESDWKNFSGVAVLSMSKLRCKSRGGV